MRQDNCNKDICDDKNNDQHREMLYGSQSDVVQQREQFIDSQFNTLIKEFKPEFFPVIPLNFNS